MLFDVTLLRSFQAVAQEASFTKAAERLNLTQSAVSSHVRRLEEQAAKSLFVRNTRSVALTGDGEILLGYARAILRLNEQELAIDIPSAAALQLQSRETRLGDLFILRRKPAGSPPGAEAFSVLHRR